MLKVSPYVLGAVVIFALLHTISPALPFLLLLAIGVPLFATFLVARLRFHGKHRPNTVAFFHPFADAKGGGERVLWAMLHSFLQSPALAATGAKFIIYTDYRDTPGRTASSILNGASSTFGISLPAADTRVEFIYLKRYKWLESSSWKRLTLLMQEVGAIIPALEALSVAVPDVVIDTHGHSFIYPVFRLLGRCLVLSYTHYPTVSTNMLQRVRDRTVMPNNSAAIAKSPLLSSLKLLYYQLFARLYALAGKCAERVMVNSTWTYNHLHAIWQPSDDSMSTVYPPCPVDALRALPLEPRQPLIVSVAQFRPEKDQKLQLESFARVMAWDRTKPAELQLKPRLILIGSVRGNEDDMARLQGLRDAAVSMGIADNVEFHTDVPNTELTDKWRARAILGLHSMRDEHFGIGVVELMASGVITIAHRSGGPQSDIVQPCMTPVEQQAINEYVTQLESKAAMVDGNLTPPLVSCSGFLAETATEYEAAMTTILRLYALRDDVRAATIIRTIQDNARASTDRFSDNAFNGAIVDIINDLIVPRLLRNASKQKST